MWGVAGALEQLWGRAVGVGLWVDDGREELYACAVAFWWTECFLQRVSALVLTLVDLFTDMGGHDFLAHYW